MAHYDSDIDVPSGPGRNKRRADTPPRVQLESLKAALAERRYGDAYQSAPISFHRMVREGRSVPRVNADGKWEQTVWFAHADPSKRYHRTFVATTRDALFAMVDGMCARMMCERVENLLLAGDLHTWAMPPWTLPCDD